MPNTKLLKPSEVCKRLNINNTKMHSLIASGALKAIRLGPKSTRVYEASVDALIGSSVVRNKKGAPPPRTDVDGYDVPSDRYGLIAAIVNKNA